MPEPSEKDPAEDKPTIPEGIIPVFLSTATQQIFNVIADNDVTDQNPYKFLKKDQLLEDIQTRAAVSDFQPLKQTITKYPGDELLLVYDYEFKYEQNFYLCVTEEAKELILNPPKDITKEGQESLEEEDQEPIPTTPLPKEWVCLGSDKEILESMLTLTRPLLQFTVAKKRCFFGRQYNFSDYNSSTNRDNYVDIPSIPSPEDVIEIKRMELETGVQAIPDTIDIVTQTEWRHPVNATTQYEPRVFSEEEADSIWQSEDIVEFMNRVTPRVEICLQQNEIMDIFHDDYLQLANDDGIVVNKSDTNLKEYQSFTDLKFSKDKIVTCIDWHPAIKGIVAVSCGQPYSYYERIELSFKLMHSSSLVLIWSFTDPIHPQLFLEAPEDILCFKFNPSNPNLIAGGCINGQIVIWDITEHQERLHINKSINVQDQKAIPATMAIFHTDPKLDHAPIVSYTVLSSIDGGHNRAVTDIMWIPEHLEICFKTFKFIQNKNNFSCQLLSSSLDGSMMFWDLRPPPQKKHAQLNKTQVNNDPYSYLHLTWKPFYKVPLSRSSHPGQYSLTCFSIKEKMIQKTKHIKETVDELGTGEGGVTLDVTLMPYQMQHSDGTLVEDAATLLCAGSEEGELVYLNWLPGKDPESGKPAPPLPSHFFLAHAGSMSAVDRSPFFSDIILTVGGWSFNIWKEGITSDALLKSGNSTVTLTGGRWSLTRPGVFFICKQNGNIDVWDLMDRSHVPSLAQNISSLSITFIIPWCLSSRQSMLAVGDSGGTLHILEVPWSLCHPSSNELSIMESFFEREVKRLEFVAERNRRRSEEKKLLDEAKATSAQEGTSQQNKDSGWEEKAKLEYNDYLKLEDTLLIELGIKQQQQEEDS